jgi:UDP-glucose 4-epimerase
MNIFVTGATGFIGSHVCKELVQRGHDVFALSHSGRTQNVKSLLPRQEFHLQQGDIQDADSLKSLIKDNRIKAIFHLAAQLPDSNNLENPFTYFDTNARGTLNMLNAAYHGGVEKFIYSSSMSVYSEPPRYLPVDESHPVQPATAYGVSKLAGELYCNLYAKEMDIVVLRYSGAYGLGERESNAILTFLNQAQNNKPITIYGDGTQTSDFVYVDDIVRGTLLAWEKGKSGVYNLGSGQEISVRELAEHIKSITKSKSEMVMNKQGTERPFHFYLDIARAKKDLGYSPHLLDAGLRIYLKELNKEV